MRLNIGDVILEYIVIDICVCVCVCATVCYENFLVKIVLPPILSMFRYSSRCLGLVIRLILFFFFTEN